MGWWHYKTHECVTSTTYVIYMGNRFCDLECRYREYRFACI